MAVLLPSLLALIFICLYAAGGSGRSHHTDAPGSCASLVCIRQAAFSAGAMSASAAAEPCRDFYEFACGGYSDRGGGGGGGSRVHEDVQLRMRRTLGRKLGGPVPGGGTAGLGQVWGQRLSQFYKACLTHHGFVGQHSSGAELMQLLRRLTAPAAAASAIDEGDDGTGGIGNFLLDKENRTVDTDSMFVAVCGKLYVPSFISVESKVLSTGESIIMIVTHVPNGLAEAGLNLSASELTEYQQFVMQAAALFVRQNGANDWSLRNSTIQTFAEDVMEIDLIRWRAYQKTLTSFSDYNKNYSISDIAEQLTMIALPACLKEIYGLESGKNSSSSTRIVVGNMAYLKEFNDQLNATQSSMDEYQRKMGNYLTWLTISYFDEYVSPEYEALAAALRQRLQLAQPWSLAGPRSRCLDYAAASMPEAVAALFADKFSDGKSTKIVGEMFSQLRSAVMKGVRKLDWMDEDTKASTEKALTDLAVSTGCPLESNEDLNNEYSSLNLSGTFLSAIGQLRQLHRRQQVRLLSQAPVTSSHNRAHLQKWTRLWSAYVQRSRYDHRVLVPAGATQLPLFSTELPRQLVYGGFGAGLAASIVSAFSVTFQEHMGAIPLLGARWLSKGSVASYYASRLCSEKSILQFVDEYRSRSVAGAQGQPYNFSSDYVDLVLMQASALKYSWRTFKDSRNIAKDTAANSRLPTFNYSHKQSFYLAYAQSQCSSSPNYFESTDRIYMYLPNRVFVNAVLASDGRFARAFNCRPSDLMHPKRTCGLPVY